MISFLGARGHYPPRRLIPFVLSEASGKDCMEKRKSIRMFLTLATIAVMIATIGMGTFASAQPTSTELTLPFTGNPANVTLNVTLTQISYITQPTQWEFSNNTPQKAYYTNSTNWVVPNSGYLFIVNNSTTSTAPSDSAINFPVANDLGSTINFMFADSRLSFNGTGETDYFLLGEENWTSPPSTSGNVKSASAGPGQNVIDIIISEYNTSAATVSVGYFAWDSAGYQNYTTYSFSSVYLNDLQWYDFMIYIQSSGTTVSIMNSTGSIIATSSTLTPVLDGNFSKITTVSYVTSFAANTAGDMLILDYSYIVDHNVYQTSAPSVPLAGAIGQIGQTVGAIAPFDPGAASESNYQQYANSSGNYLSTNVSIGDFSNITNSSTIAAQNSGLINTSLAPQANQTFALSPNALTDVRTASYLPTAITTNLYVTTWTPAGINTAITQYLQSTIGNMINVVPNEVDVISYTVTAMGFNILLSNGTMTEVGNYLDNAIPGILSANGLALENTQTGAIEAGAMAGYFWNDGSIAAPVIHGNIIENPLTGQYFSSLSDAGFPVGSYIFAGSIIVPQWKFMGFAADGQPIFNTMGLNPFGALSGAAAAVNSFFHSAASTVSNALGTVKNTVSDTAAKIVNIAGNGLVQPLSTASKDIEKAGASVMPFMGGAIGKLGSDISGTISHALSGVDSGLADMKSSVTGAIVAGVNDVKQGFYGIGNLAKNGIATVYTTLGKAGNTIHNVISPITTTVRNLPTGLVNGTQTLVKGATGFGESIASDAKNLGIGIKNGFMGALDTVGNTITSAGREVKNAFGSVGSAVLGAVKAPFSFFSGLSNNVAHIIEYAAIGGVVIILLIVGLYYFGHSESRKRRHE